MNGENGDDHVYAYRVGVLLAMIAADPKMYGVVLQRLRREIDDPQCAMMRSLPVRGAAEWLHTQLGELVKAGPGGP